MVANVSNIIRKDTFHYKWSKSHEPVVTIKPGESVTFEVNEVTSWQVTQKSVPEDMARIDASKLYPLAGPVYVEGAMPGDALEVRVESVMPASWGWTGISPGLGLLEEFTTPDLFVWDLSNRSAKYAKYLKGIEVPLNPFCGVLGVAPPEEGFFDVLPPGRHGGNMDIRHLTRGSKVLIPVWNKGALFSVADLHAAQGDGEVCISAIECPGEVTLSFDVKKDARIEWPCYYSKPLFGSDSEVFATTGIASDLMAATKQAVRNMILHLKNSRGLLSGEAYMLCSVAGELRIHEIVDAPNWVVGLMLPRHMAE